MVVWCHCFGSKPRLNSPPRPEPRHHDSNLQRPPPAEHLTALFSQDSARDAIPGVDREHVDGGGGILAADRAGSIPASPLLAAQAPGESADDAEGSTLGGVGERRGDGRSVGIRCRLASGFVGGVLGSGRRRVAGSYGEKTNSLWGFADLLLWLRSFFLLIRGVGFAHSICFSFVVAALSAFDRQRP